MRDLALRTLGESPELLGPSEQAVLRTAVAEDNPIEVAWIAASILDDIDSSAGDEAWRVYTSRPDAPDHVKGSPKPEN